MTEPLAAWYARFVDAVRTAFFVIAIGAALASTAAWAVRSRKVNPFGLLARLTRTWVDPMLRPVERMILRAGGTPTTAPWWGLVLILIVGLPVIGALALFWGVI